MANLITIARLCAVPIAIWLVLHQHFTAAFVLFVLAGISDAIDGWLARRQGTTTLGAVLDPLADKTLMTGMYITLAVIGQLPDWLAMLVVFRDMLIVGGVVMFWMISHSQVIAPLMISKVNTALQIGLVAVFLGLDALGAAALPFRATMIALVTISTLVSGAAYVARAVRPA